MGFLEELLPRVDPSVQISNFTLESPGRGSRWSHLRNANAVWHLLAHCLSSADRRIHQDAVIMDQRHSECSERRANAVRAPCRRSETMLGVLLALWSRSHLFPRVTVCFQGQSHSQSSGLHPCHQTAAWMLCVVVVMASLETLSFWCWHSWNHPMIQPHIWNIPLGSTVIFKGGDMLEQQKWRTWSPMASE